MIRTAFLCLILTLSSTLSFSQSYLGSAGNDFINPTSIKRLDKGITECIFLLKTYDPVLKEIRESYDILEIGKNFSLYSNYGSYRMDSVLQADFKNGLSRQEFSNLTYKYSVTYEALLKNLRNQQMQVYDKIFTDRFVYEEQIPEIEWQLESDTLTICGQLCQKATTLFRGRNWTAWYSEIPLTNGPWKFGNLPGLILKAEDDTGEHVFEAISLRNGMRDFGIKDFNYFRTKRERFNKTLQNFCLKPQEFLSQELLNAKNTDGSKASPLKRLFFSPLEKE